MMKKKNSKVPGPMRTGIALLILGAIVVGAGTLLNRDALSLYGFIVVVCGFFLYFASSIYLKKQEKSKTK
jgi:membrane-bound ClpP family serine protease